MSGNDVKLRGLRGLGLSGVIGMAGAISRGNPILNMNATIKTLTALLAAGFPAAYLGESYGINLPDAINSAHAFGAFVIAVTVLTMMADYKPHRTLVAVSAAEPARVPAAAKAKYRLAA